jgi:hypothetical protein
MRVGQLSVALCVTFVVPAEGGCSSVHTPGGGTAIRDGVGATHGTGGSSTTGQHACINTGRGAAGSNVNADACTNVKDASMQGSGASGTESPALPCQGACASAPVGVRPIPGDPPNCPSKQPKPGEACDLMADQLCGYGDDTYVACRAILDCVDHKWSLKYQMDCPSRDFCLPTAPKHESMCTVGAGGQEVPCDYDGFYCVCAGGPNVGPGVKGYWNCWGPPADPNCPAKLPNLGTGCSTKGVECWYATNGCFSPANFVFCRNGQWELGAGPVCPL